MSAKGTVFVTGASGFIAKHVVSQLLEAGYRVRGSVRSPARGAEVMAAVRPSLTDAADLDDRLSFAALDLLRDEGWEDAMQGCEALIHTASPFPLEQPRDAEEVIRPAVDGTVRALNAAQAAGIARVVTTSSSVAVINRDLEPGRETYDERDWSDLTGPRATSYVRSKVLAERAAWEFVEDRAPDMQLTAINPVFVLGAPLGHNLGTSFKVIQRVLRAKDPMLPNVGLMTVDVRDIATMHVRALDRPETVGKRILGASRFLWFVEIARTLKDAYPDRKIVTRQAPDMLIRMLALFDGAVRTIVPNLGREEQVSNARARSLLGVEFRDTRDSIVTGADYLLRNGLV